MHPLACTSKAHYAAVTNNAQVYPNQAAGEAHLKQLLGDDYENIIAATVVGEGTPWIMGSDLDIEMVATINDWVNQSGVSPYTLLVPFSEEDYEALIPRRVDEFISSAVLEDGRTLVLHVVVTSDDGAGVIFYQVM